MWYSKISFPLRVAINHGLVVQTLVAEDHHDPEMPELLVPALTIPSPYNLDVPCELYKAKREADGSARGTWRCMINVPWTNPASKALPEWLEAWGIPYSCKTTDSLLERRNEQSKTV